MKYLRTLSVILILILSIGSSQKLEIVKKEGTLVSNEVLKLETNVGSSTNLFYKNNDHLYLERFCIRYGERLYTSDNMYPLKDLRVLKGDILEDTKTMFSDDKISIERSVDLPSNKKWIIIKYKIILKNQVESINFYQGVDFDVDNTVNFDYGEYDELTDIVYTYEKTYLGLSSPIRSTNHDLSVPYYKVWLNIMNDSLNNALLTNVGDSALALEWQLRNFTKEIEIPVILAIGDDLEELKENIEDGKKYLGKPVTLLEDDRKLFVDYKEPVEVFQGQKTRIKIPVFMESEFTREALHDVTLNFPPEIMDWIVEIEPESLDLERNKAEYFTVELNIPPPFSGRYDFIANVKSREGIRKDFQITFIVKPREETSIFEGAISLLLHFFKF